MLEQVDEVADRAVAVMPRAVDHVLGEVERQRTVRPEQPGVVDPHCPGPGRDAGRLIRVHRLARELQGRVLLDPHSVFGRPLGLTEARRVRIGALDDPHRCAEVVLRGFLDELVEVAQSRCRLPIRGGHFAMDPRSTTESEVCVNELSAT